MIFSDAILTCFICIGTLFTSIITSLHETQWAQQNYYIYTQIYGFVSVIDVFLNIVSTYLSFYFNEIHYQKYCDVCHSCCLNWCNDTLSRINIPQSEPATAIAVQETSEI